MEKMIDSFMEEFINTLTEKTASFEIEHVKKMAQDYIAFSKELARRMHESTLDEKEKASVFKGFLGLMLERGKTERKEIPTDLSYETVKEALRSSKMVSEYSEIDNLFNCFFMMQVKYGEYETGDLKEKYERVKDKPMSDETFDRLTSEFEREFVENSLCFREDFRALEKIMEQTFPELDKYLR